MAKWTRENTRWHALTPLQRREKLKELCEWLEGQESALNGFCLHSFRNAGALIELCGWVKSGEGGEQSSKCEEARSVRLPYPDD